MLNPFEEPSKEMQKVKEDFYHSLKKKVDKKHKNLTNNDLMHLIAEEIEKFINKEHNHKTYYAIVLYNYFCYRYAKETDPIDQLFLGFKLKPPEPECNRISNYRFDLKYY